MAIDAINVLTSTYKGIKGAGQDQTTESSSSFGEILKQQLDKVNDLQIEADKATQELAVGDADNAHDVMIKSEEAKLSLYMAVQVRNKLIEAYQEIMKLQV